MAQKLTKKMIDAFTYDGGWDVRWDAAIPGFGVRIYPSGKKSYVLSYRHKGQKRLLRIAQVGKLALDEARNKAFKELAKLSDDIDPLEDRRKKAPKRAVKKVFEEYLEKYAKPKNKSWKETKRIFDHDVIPAFGNKAVHDVTRQDVLRLLDKIAARGSGTMANRTLAHVRKFFRWCQERDLIDSSPAAALGKPAPETARDRVLTEEEIRTVWDACRKEGYPYGILVRLCLVTAQRLGEVSAMRWRDIDLEKNLWILPREATKAKRRHDVPLSGLAVRLLCDIPREESESTDDDYVFTTTRGKRPFSGFAKAKERLDDNIVRHSETEGKKPPPPWRIHDLRRTAASGMAALRVSPHVIERILNHSSGIVSGVAAVYNRYDYAREMREGLELWAANLEKSAP